MTDTALIPRATVSEICRLRGLALAQFEGAYEAMTSAQDALKTAYETMRRAGPLKENRYNCHLSDRERRDRDEASGTIRVPPRDAFMAEWKRTVETEVWARVVEATDLGHLMDKQAKDDLAQDLMRDPPEATEENIFATLETWRLTAGDIFRRGIANVFSSLDRRFKSHDGFKVGSRIILTGAFNEWGSWSYYRNHRDTFTDIERTFFVLDGRKPPLDYAGVVGAIDSNRQGGLRPHQSDAESEFFRIHCFKNGNAHVWFKRDDLVEKVNRLLAEHYGEVIPDGQTAEEDPLATPKTSLAKNYGFFPTPPALAEQLFEDIPLYRDKSEPPLTVLEPNAGTGHLARLAAARGCTVDCIEIQPILAAKLRVQRIQHPVLNQEVPAYRRVIQADFLALNPDPNALYDRVVMNPPFDRERDIDHVMHALRFLKDGGHLTAIMSAGTGLRETRKSEAFRNLMEKMGAHWRDLPAGSFSSVGTNINTVVLSVRKKGARS